MSAWNQTDIQYIRQSVRRFWADDASYVDPTMGKRLVGLEAVVERMDEFVVSRSASYLEPSAWITSDLHHGYAQVRWRLCSGFDTSLADGVDFLELGPDGRIERATRFFAIDAEPRRPVCTPPVGDWTGIPEIARKWAETTSTDASTRRALIREIFAPDGFYVDPSDVAPVVGHAAITDRVAGMLWDGAFFEPAAWTESDVHNGVMRLRWRLCDSGAPGLEGVDYVDLDATGRFTRVVGFFPWP